MSTLTTSTFGKSSRSSDGFTIVKAKHPGRWIAAGVLLALVALVLYSVFTNDRFGWPVVAYYFTDFSIARGLLITLELRD